jgi:hypothetical protein
MNTRRRNPFTLVFGVSAVGGFVALYFMVIQPAIQALQPLFEFLK